MRRTATVKLQLEARDELLNGESYTTLCIGQGDHRELETALPHRSPAHLRSATHHPRRGSSCPRVQLRNPAPATPRAHAGTVPNLN